ncbi:MAG: hypothetical protein QW390_02730 [Candidatus Bathyarchaeia archaeon]
MHELIKSITYFQRPGPENTSQLISVVRERIGIGDLNIVVVPSTTGKTAELFERELGGEAEIVEISEDETASMCKVVANREGGLLRKLIESRLDEASRRGDPIFRRDAYDLTLLPFCGKKFDAVSNILYAFGQGMKVAIEISIAAVETSKVKPYIEVISVGGTGQGADTAIVVRTSTQEDAFGKIANRRLSILEIIAMPRWK